MLSKEKAEEYGQPGLILGTGPGDILGDTGAGPPPSMKLLLYQTLSSLIFRALPSTKPLTLGPAQKLGKDTHLDPRELSLGGG